ncbi:hypothetical protein CHLRE_06g257183v5 [Chlamydomonas reinhardtii]|uniref:Uncharacterized protein n=1 Tax=Chlamydomonas reinhardtii TaxID=3055 RepID=A0A2K3DMH0_CHLRE|nr:uncharacterized protein CHLRE_06g257183v5 [Chlamydomonas reinhardtii]PNW81713.1 hypothetical protein CHLRE_06g257183v5 [Chlamydomonas reinhardtii]
MGPIPPSHTAGTQASGPFLPALALHCSHLWLSNTLNNAALRLSSLQIRKDTQHTS